MGIDRRVVLDESRVVAWSAIAERLAGRGFNAELRMIDGQLSLPDESPPPNWSELRIATPAGMLTLRRQTAGIVVTTWGNAVGPLLHAWNAVAWAIADATTG